MTREEAILELETMIAEYAFNADEAMALGMAVAALRPVSRERVRRGEWEKIGADYRGQGGIWKCTACGKTYPYKCDFCPRCGAPMTDKAVDIIMERLEALSNAVD